MWNSSNPAEMARFIKKSGMTLSAAEENLLSKAEDINCFVWSVFDLHWLNVLCFQATGWTKCAQEIRNNKRTVKFTAVK